MKAQLIFAENKFATEKSRALLRQAFETSVMITTSEETLIKTGPLIGRISLPVKKSSDHRDFIEIEARDINHNLITVAHLHNWMCVL